MKTKNVLSSRLFIDLGDELLDRIESYRFVFNQENKTNVQRNQFIKNILKVSMDKLEEDK